MTVLATFPETTVVVVEVVCDCKNGLGYLESKGGGGMMNDLNSVFLG